MMAKGGEGRMQTEMGKVEGHLGSPFGRRGFGSLPLSRRILWAILCFVLTTTAPFVSAATPPSPASGKKVSAVLAGSEKGLGEEVLSELRRIPPRDDEDWASIDRACKRGDLYKRIAVVFVGLPRPYDATATAGFSKLVENGCDMAMMVALDEIRREKLTGALPAIRRRLKRERGFHPFAGVASGARSLLGENSLGARRRKFLLGWALGELQDRESLDLLYSTDEYFCGGGADQLARMGPTSLERAIRIVKTENGRRQNVARAIIMASSYPGAYAALAKLLPGADTETRFAVAFALQGSDPATPGLEVLLLSLKNDPDKRVRILGVKALFSRYPAKYRAEILECIVRPHHNAPYPYALDRLDALGIASSGKVPGIEKELEEFIRSCGHSGTFTYNICEIERAAEGIWRATGKKVLYRLPDHLEVDGKPPRYPWDK